jgi:predicted ABC-type transport system involved in lysophospholipase L1 biosynthesis ATPase subunit
LNFNPNDRSSSCRRGDAEAKINGDDSEIVMQIFFIVESMTALSQIKENLSIANCV